MKIALVGYGKMGRALDEQAAALGYQVVSRIDPRAAERSHDAISAEAVAAADLCLEFSRPDAAVANVRRLAALGKPMVIGTTGWYGERAAVHRLLVESGVAAVYAENFAIGMQFFCKAVAAAARYAAALDGLDVALSEEHHRHKADSPSGTALALADQLEELLGQRPAIGVLRCGAALGSHTVHFDLPHERVTMTHQARSRQALACGALRAARLLPTQAGLHHLRDLL